MFEKLTQLMDGFLEMGIPGYDCIIYKDGKELFRRMGGVQRQREENPRQRWGEVQHLFLLETDYLCGGAAAL